MCVTDVRRQVRANIAEDKPSSHPQSHPTPHPTPHPFLFCLRFFTQRYKKSSSSGVCRCLVQRSFLLTDSRGDDPESSSTLQSATEGKQPHVDEVFSSTLTQADNSRLCSGSMKRVFRTGETVFGLDASPSARDHCRTDLPPRVFLSPQTRAAQCLLNFIPTTEAALRSCRVTFGPSVLL